MNKPRMFLSALLSASTPIPGAYAAPTYPDLSQAEKTLQQSLQDNQEVHIEIGADVLERTVRVTVSKDGHVVLGLRQRSFRVFEDGAPQEFPVHSVVPEDEPLSLGIAVDTSGSMRDSKAQILKFIDLVNQARRGKYPDDEIILLKFNEKGSIYSLNSEDSEAVPGSPCAPERSARKRFMTTDEEFDDFKNAVANDLAQHHRTRLFDAAHESVHYVSKWSNPYERRLLNKQIQCRPRKKAVLLISDGEDSADEEASAQPEDRKSSRHATIDDVIGAAQEKDVAVCAVRMPDPDSAHEDRKSGSDNLKGMAKETGGAVVLVRTLKEVQPKAEDMLEFMRRSYRLIYHPIDAKRRYKKIGQPFKARKIEARDSGGNLLLVHVLPGYSSPEDKKPGGNQP